MDESILQKIKECELLLIGIGEDFDLTRENSIKHQIESFSLSEDEKWMIPYLKRELTKGVGEDRVRLYDQFAESIKGKNYFVVSLAMDGTIAESALDQERVVEPCGGFGKMQCADKCSSELYEVDERLCGEILQYAQNRCEGLNQKPAQPVCPLCQKPLIFNNVEAENYLEDGYLKKWEKYRKWLQGTVNKKVCILELGTGLKYPTVIRWPFEKVAFFNQKAAFIRVHSRLYQTTEEIKDKSVGVCQSPEEFLRELSKAL